MDESTVTNGVTPAATRLRESPVSRFDGPQHFFDLLDLSAHLLNEAHVGANGHRQMTLLRHDATTIMLVAFEAGGEMADHKANGLVTIHVLDGALRVEAQGEAADSGEAQLQTHDLQAQQVLVLAPGVVHSVSAHQPSRMLLTVHMERGAAAPQ